MKMCRNDEVSDPSKIILVKHDKIAKAFKSKIERAEENMPSAGEEILCRRLFYCVINDRKGYCLEDC